MKFNTSEDMYQILSKIANTGRPTYLTITSTETNETESFRVTVERVEPEPEKRWWWCYWKSKDASFASVKTTYSLGTLVDWGEDGEVRKADTSILSATEPTLEEFADAVKAATGVDLPIEREEAQWHYWNPYGWQTSEPKPRRAYVFFDAFDNSGQVWGTRSDRDAKRDALLEAAKAAGKGGDA